MVWGAGPGPISIERSSTRIEYRAGRAGQRPRGLAAAESDLAAAESAYSTCRSSYTTDSEGRSGTPETARERPQAFIGLPERSNMPRAGSTVHWIAWLSRTGGGHRAESRHSVHYRTQSCQESPAVRQEASRTLVRRMSWPTTVCEMLIRPWPSRARRLQVCPFNVRDGHSGCPPTRTRLAVG